MICTNGAIVSRTITLNPALVTLPAASVAEQVTRVTPIANPLPEGGKQLIGTVPLTTSKALAAYVTTAPKGLVASATTSGGIVSTGRVVSRTTTRTSDEACFPRPSSTVSVMACDPMESNTASGLPVPSVRAPSMM